MPADDLGPVVELELCSHIPAGLQNLHAYLASGPPDVPCGRCRVEGSSSPSPHLPSGSPVSVVTKGSDHAVRAPDVLGHLPFAALLFRGPRRREQRTARAPAV